MANIIDFKIKVDDIGLRQVGANVKGLMGQFEHLKGVIKGIEGNRLGGSFESGNQGLLRMLVTANLLADAIKGVAATAIDFGKERLVEGAKSQIQQINFSGALSAQLDMAYKDAGHLADEITTMSAKAAASLPGETKDYIAIATQSFDDIAAIYKSQGKSIKQATADFKPMLETWGVLATSVGVDGERAGQDLNRLINGTLSLAQLRRLEIFQKNPLFMKNLKKVSDDMGIDLKNFQNIDIGKRLEIIQKALSGSVTPEQLDALRNSVDGQWQGWKSNLLDPVSGLFGFMRKINFDGVAGFEGFSGKSVMDALGSAMSKITDALTVLAPVLPKLADPMMSLFKLITNLGNGIQGMVDRFLDSPFVKMQKGFDQLSKEYGSDNKGRSMVKRELISAGKLSYTVDWSGLISNKIIEIVKEISDIILKAPLVITKSFDLATLGDTIGRLAASGINSLTSEISGKRVGNYAGKLTNNLGILFTKIVWGVSNMIDGLGAISFSGLGKSIASVVNAVSGYLSKVNLGDIGTIVSKSINALLSALTSTMSSMVGNIQFGDIGAMLANIINGVLSSIGKLNFVGSLASIGSTIGSYINGLFTTTLSLLGKLDFTRIGFVIGKTIGDLLSSAALIIANFLSKVNWGNLVSIAGQIISGLGQILIGAVGGLVASIAGNAPALILASISVITNLIFQSGSGLVQLLVQLVITPIQLIGSGFSAIGLLIATIATNIVNTFSAGVQIISSGIKGISDVFSGIGGMIQNVGTTIYNGLVSLFKGIISNISGGFSNSTTSIFNIVGESITGIQNSLSQWFNGLVDSIKMKLASIPGISQALNGLGINPTSSPTTTTPPSTVAPAAATPPSTVAPAAASPNLGAEQAALKAQHRSAYNGLNLQRVNIAYKGLNLNRIESASDGFNMAGLLSAAKMESSKMPAGANLVMANSSETIIPRDRSANLSRPQVNSSPTMNITINVTGSNDPLEVAHQVVRHISNSFKEYKLINAIA